LSRALGDCLLSATSSYAHAKMADAQTAPFRGNRVDRRCPPPRLLRYPPAARCQSVRIAAPDSRTPNKGRKLPKLTQLLTDPATVWTTISMSQWYGGKRCRLAITSATAIWYHHGLPPLPIRCVLVRNPAGIRKPQAFLCTDLTASPATILGWYVHRWSIDETIKSTAIHQQSYSRSSHAAALARGRREHRT
jgi:hypothetical protein